MVLNGPSRSTCTTGVRIIEVATGYGMVELPDAAHLLNHLDTQHGGALFAVGEAAAGAAYVGTFYPYLGEIRMNAQEAHVTYQRWAKGPIVARSDFEQDPRYVREATAV
jgi:acyl-coenzyme A thioesterase PaaI-like protein